MRLGLILSFALLVVAGGIVLLSAVRDVRGRDASPEAVIRGYFMALEAGDLDDALQAIDPSARAASSSFVANMLNNEYRISGIAVRQPSVLGRLMGEPDGAREATIFLTITQAVDGIRWEAGPRVHLVQQSQRWYLARPPLAD